MQLSLKMQKTGSAEVRESRSGFLTEGRKAFFPTQPSVVLHHLPLWSALCLLLLAACDFPIPQSDEVPAPRSCVSDSDCDSSRKEVCRLFDGTGSPSATAASSAADGICIIQGTPTEREIWLEIRPERSTGLPQTQLGPINLGDGQNQELVVPSPAKISGEVVYSGTKPAEKVGGARLRFRMNPLIPGRPLVFDLDSENSDEALGQVKPRLLPEGQYTLQLSPPQTAEQRLPGEVTQELELESGEELNRQFVLTNPEEMIQVSGILQIEREGDLHPAAQVEVWASEALESLSLKRGAPLAPPSKAASTSGRMLSQATSSDENGHFTLLLPRLDKKPSHRFHLQTGVATGDRPFPSFTTDEIFEVDENSDLGKVFLGELSEVVEVSLKVIDGNNRALPNARVVLRSWNSPFSYSVSAETDRKGQATFKVFPGLWTAGAHPPPGSEWGLCGSEELLELGASPDGEASPQGSALSQTLQCPGLSRLAGHVLDHRQTQKDGHARFIPVPKVAIEAVRQPDSIFPDPIHIHGTTRHDGTFALDVPAGRYDLSIVPPSSAKLPPKHLRSLEVELDSDPDSEPLVVAVVLDEAFELFGNLHSGSSANPMGGTLEAYAVDADGEVLQVGRGIAQSDGRYSILLPGLAR